MFPRFIGAIAFTLFVCSAGNIAAQIPNPVADQAITGFNNAFIHESGGLTFYKTALNKTEKDYFWQQALDIQTTQDAFDRTHDERYKILTTKLLDAFLAQNSDAGTSGGWKWNEYNDDLIWGVQAFIRGYEITGNATYLNQAKYGFNLSYYHNENGGWGWDNIFGGGLWWDKAKSNKNTLSNAPTVVAACRIYKATGDVFYLNKAKEIYEWTRTYLSDPNTGQVFSEIAANGTLNRTQLVFNNGSFAGAANWLYQLTGEKKYFDDAKLAIDRVITNMTAGGKLASGQRNGTDLAEYIRHFGEFVSQNHLWDSYYVFLKTSADAAWNVRRTDLNIAWNDFTKPTPVDNVTSTNECNSAAVIQQVLPLLQPLPGTIEAEHYNYMLGIQLEDLTEGNGKLVGHFDPGDWVEYLVSVTTPGVHVLSFKVASTAANPVKLQDNGETVATINVPNTGGWQVWQTVNVNVNLTPGIHALRLTSVNSAWNIDKFTATLTTPAQPGLIQAESYASMSGVGTENTTDLNGGLSVGFIDPGDWMEYQVNVPVTGTYALSYRVATEKTGVIALQVGGKTLNSTVVPNTGNWQHWQTLTTRVALNAGVQTIRLFNSGDPWNINWFSLTQDNLPPPSSTGMVTVYSNCNFAGSSIGLALGSYTQAKLNSLGFFDDDASSLKVTAGNQVVLYSEDNFSGESISLTANNTCLTSINWDNKVSSMKVVPAIKAFMAGDNVAAFYPNTFDSLATLPSFIFKNNLTRTGSVSASWSITPSFSFENGKNVVSIPYTGDVDFYGNGEVTGPLKRNGTHVTLWNTDNPAFDVDNGKRIYQSHPWIMGVRADGTAFGIIADNTWKQEFAITNPITITSDGPGFRVIIIERSSPQELIRTLGELTGKIELPPLWTLGFQQSRFSYVPASTVRNIANEFRNRKIPCDVIWMDIDYMDHFKVFTFDPGGFSDPKGLNDYLHNKNFKAVYMIDPGVKKETGYFVYDQGSAGNHWVKRSDGTDFTGQVWPPVVSFPDYTKPATRTWWASLYKDFMAKGIDGVWNDMNEPSVFDTPNKTMLETNLHAGGGDLPPGTHARYHNVYGYLMVRASREGIVSANPGKRPFLLSRSNFLGGQRYAATWTGDNSSTWDHLKLSIPMSITLGLSGQPVSGPDIGGFTGNCTPDLLGHWMAIGAYYPFSRNHTISGSVSQEPWAFGSEIEKVSRTAVNRRYRLLPYLYTLMREASQNGMPLMRPVFFADHTDKSLREEQQAFLLGNDLLVVPRWAVNPKLPNGDWEKLKLETADDRYQANLFVRPGAVIPLGNIIQSTVDYKSDSVTLLLNPLESGMASGLLYHDDGDGYAYQVNNFATHQFSVTKHNADTLKVSIVQIEGSKVVNRVYRVGYVTENGVVYFPWSPSPVRYVPFLKDSKATIDLNTVNAMYVVGNFKNNDFVPMKLINEKQWRADSIYFQTGQTYTLRFSQSNNKLTGTKWGAAMGLSGTVSVVTDTLAAVTFSVPSNDYYSVAFDQTSLRYVIQKTPEITSLSIAGDATLSFGWDLRGLPMQQSVDDLNVFTWVGKLTGTNGSTEGKFKFHFGRGGPCEDVWIYAATPDQSLSATSLVIANGCSVPDYKWKVPPGTSDTYKITINVATKKITIQKLLNTLAIVGDATVVGWNPTGLAMQQAPDRPNIFTWTGALSASTGSSEGKFKFHSGTGGFCDGTWLYATIADQSLSATPFVMATGCTVPDNKWKVKTGESGNYRITVDVDAKTVRIQKELVSLAIVGDATSKGWDTKGLPMQQSADNANVFTWTGMLSASNGTTEGRFKFHSGVNGFCDDTWLYASTADQSLSSASTVVMASGCSMPDNKWKVQPSEAGNYKVTVSIEVRTISLQKVIPTLAIVGDATAAGWNTTGLPMQRSVENENLFTWTGTLSASNGTTEGKFKFHSGTGGFCDDTWLFAATADQSLSGTTFVMGNGCTVADNKWKVNAGETGTYKITVDLQSKKIRIQKVILPTLSIVGDATSAGWNPVGLPMQQSSGNINVFTWTGTLSASNGTTEGKFKFHSGTGGFCDDSWLYGTIDNQSLSATSFVMATGCTAPDNKWKVNAGETGTYRITIDLSAKTVVIQKIILSSLSIVGDATSVGWNPVGLPMQQSADNPNLFTWAGTLSASSGTSEGKFKFHSGFNGWCDDTWLYATVTDQSLIDSLFVLAPQCTAPDYKWKVRMGETSVYQIRVDVEKRKIKIQNLTTPDIVMDVDQSQESGVVVQVFPNPASEYVTLRIIGLKQPPSAISLHDLRGSKLLNIDHLTNAHTQEIQLPMAQFSAGVYLVKVETEVGVFVKMIMK